MKKIFKTKHYLRFLTTAISIIFIFSTIGFTNGIQTNNIKDITDNSRGTTYLSVVPSNQTVDYNENFSIIIHLDPGVPVIGVQIDLSFNASLVHANSVANANPSVWNFFQPGSINNTEGEIHGACVAILGSTVTTPTDCFNISFTAKNTSGTSPLTLHNVIITDQNASPIIPVINNGQVIVVGTINLPPIFGTPSPANGSTDQPLSFTWSIPINDPEGNLFSWTIQCSNGQNNSGNNATNGTKSLVLSGLAYSKTYTVWVNATDPGGSGQYTRAWYTFTTKASLPPVFGTPSPANGSTDQPLSFTWSIPINDPEGDLFSWTIQCSNGQSNSGSNASNGTKSLVLSGLAYSKTYTVWVNATDPGGSGQYTRAWYTFTTKASLPPVFGTPSPANGSTDQPLSFTWSIPINDPEGDLFSWSIECSNGQSNSSTDASNGTKSLVLSGLAYSTTYTVWVNATDPGGSGQYTKHWYTFTTQKENLPPNAPSNPSPENGSTNVIVNIVLSWVCSDPNGDPLTYDVYFGTSSSPPKVVSNQSAISYNPGTLTYNTTYYWSIVAWDNHNTSNSSPVWQFTTAPNYPPNTPNAPSGPPNGKTGVSYTYTTNTTDHNGDRIYYQFDWGDGSNSGWIGPYNSGEQASASHSWTTGTYSIKVKAKDVNNAESEWSEPTSVKIPRNLDMKTQILNRIKQLLQRFLQFNYIFFSQLIQKISTYIQN